MTDAVNSARSLEIELLLCCARVHMDDAGAARARTLLANTLDWEYLLALASRHALRPLLYHHLRAIQPDLVPEAILRELHIFFRDNAVQNLCLAGELTRLLRLFAAHEIPVVPYKGPVLAEIVYGNLALREFGDLDILVRGEDVFKVRDLVLSSGYQPLHALKEGQEEVLLRNQHHFNFFSENKNISLEVHWRIVKPYIGLPFDLESLWDHLVPISYSGLTVPSFSPEDLLLVLSVHGTKHRWERLEWVCGVAETIRSHPEIDWELVMRRAEIMGGKRVLLLSLFLVEDLLSVAIPAEVSREVRRDKTVKVLGKQVRTSLFKETTGDFNPFGLTRFIFKLKETPKDKLQFSGQYLLRSLSPDAYDWKVVSLPPSLSFIYYLIRPFRLGAIYALRPILQDVGKVASRLRSSITGRNGE